MLTVQLLAMRDEGLSVGGGQVRCGRRVGMRHLEVENVRVRLCGHVRLVEKRARVETRDACRAYDALGDCRRHRYLGLCLGNANRVAVDSGDYPGCRRDRSQDSDASTAPVPTLGTEAAAGWRENGEPDHCGRGQEDQPEWEH